MIDALLFAIRDEVVNSRTGWDQRTCQVMGDQGQPPPFAGDWFCAVHQAGSSSEMDNALDELFDFDVTLTRRLAGVPLDRLGDQLLASRTARTMAKETGFNARAEQLRSMLHMDWGALGDANNYLVGLFPQANVVYGFCEPARYRGMDTPRLVGPSWFMAEEPSGEGLDQVGLVASLHFKGARRLQAIATYT